MKSLVNLSRKQLMGEMIFFLNVVTLSSQNLRKLKNLVVVVVLILTNEHIHEQMGEIVTHFHPSPILL